MPPRWRAAAHLPYVNPASDSPVFIRRKASPGVQEGPFPLGEFLRRIEQRELSFGDFAWREGMPDWILAGSLALHLKRRTPPL